MTESEKNGEAKKLPQYVAALSVCLGSVACGTVLGWTANITEELKNGDLNDIDISGDDISWIGSLATLGAMTMCFPIGLICDWIGRKWAMLILVVPFVVGWILIIFSTHISMIFIGRFVTGMAGGAFCISAPMYTSEIAQKEIRGALGAYFQLLLTVGILFANVMAYIDVKVYTGILCIVPGVFALAFFFQPETPVYSLKKGKDLQARQALIRLRGKNYNVDQEIKEIKMSLEEDERNKSPFFKEIGKKAAIKASIIAYGLMFFQQLGGINAVIFYTGDIFEDANASLGAKEATILVGGMQVVATFVSSLIIDKLGRKILLIGSGVVQSISIILLGIYFTLRDRDVVDEDTIDSLGFLPIFSMCLYITVFSLGFGPIPWMIASEISPPAIKTILSSTAGIFNWFLAFLVTKFYADIVDALQRDVTFYFFGGISFIGAVFVLVLVPETKGKSLEQIQRELNGESEPSSGMDNPAYSG